MASIINATTTAGVSVQGDNSGSLQLATNNGTTAVTIDTSQRAAFVAGTAALPAITTTGDTNTGMWFPAADTIATSTAGSERMRINSAGQIAWGTSSIDGYLTLTWAGQTYVGFVMNNTDAFGTSTNIRFKNNGTTVGEIASTTTTTSYNTSSDYRLKENIAPMTGALAKVQQLKPSTYTWKVDGSDGQGFIAHELQAVIPDAVTGEKDGTEDIGTITDANGGIVSTNVKEPHSIGEGLTWTKTGSEIKYQMVDTSFLVATLTAAIQELKAELDATKAEVQALKGVA